MKTINIPFNFVVILIKGRNSSGQNVFHYAAIKEESIDKFLQAVNSQKPYDIKDYGMVIESGLDEPADEIKDKMEKMYGFNHNAV